MKLTDFIDEGYNDNRTGFSKRKREDDEYHTPDPTTRTHKIVHTVSKEGGEKHSRTVTISNSTKSREEAKAAAREHLKKQGYTIHEETELDEAVDPSEIASNPRMYNSDTVKKAYYHKKASESDKQSLARHLDRHHGNKEWRKAVKEEALDEATPYHQKASWIKKMSAAAKQERLAREKKEKEAKTVKESAMCETCGKAHCECDDSHGYVKEDVATSEYKIKKTVGADGKTHTRKIRPHVVRFKNSKKDGEPAENTNRDDKEDMKKESIEMVSFSQFQQEGVMDTLKKVGKKVLDTVGHGDDEAMKKDLQKKMGVPQTGKPSMAKQNEEFQLEEEALVENRINHRDFAADGRMHPTMANHAAYKTGSHVDFYSSKNGDKLHGKVVKNDSKNVHIQTTVNGSDSKDKTVHKFKVSNTAPHQMKEETELDESIDMKNAPMGDVVKDFQQSDAPQFAGKSKEKRQQMAIAAKLSAGRGGKKMSFKEMMELYAPVIVEGSEDEKENDVSEANAFDWKSGGHKDSSKFDSKKTSTGTQYTRKYDSKTGETEDEKSDKPAEKRKAGRPAGSKSGANQKGSEKKSDYRGMGTYSIHLPNNNK